MHRTLLAVSALALLLAPGFATAQAPNKLQQRCMNELNRAAARVADATTNELLRCARSAVKNRLPDGQTLEQCVAADSRQRILRAHIAADVAQARWCVEPPPFGPIDVAQAKAVLGALEQVPAVFGPDAAATLGASDGEPQRAACQIAVVRGMRNLVRARLGEFNRCTKAGLRAGTIVSSDDLEDCLASDARGRVARAEANAVRQVERSCTGQPIAELLPGDCAAQPLVDLTSCVEARVHCELCTDLNALDRMTGACHRFADGVATNYCGEPPVLTHSVARLWDEEILAAIRIDTPRPTVHARNLWHLSIAMWDSWAAYDDTADLYLHDAHATADDVEEARRVAISFAAYRLLHHRFANSPGAATSLARFDELLYALGLDEDFTSTDGAAPAALGNRIAQTVIDYGLADGSNEQGNYADPTYTPLNDPLVWKDPGNFMMAPSNWQPLALDVIIGQNGVPIPGKIQVFLGSSWRDVLPFALERSGPGVPYFDPFPPPRLDDPATNAEFKDQAVDLIQKQSLLDSTDPTTIDASPGVLGNNTLGMNDGTGHPLNPVTGAPYAPNIVKRNDFYRVLGMYWADGPDSETPPGHWNVVANEVSDDPLFEKRFAGAGPVLSDLEWDVKLYFTMNGAVHDAAVAAWEQKRIYDSVRPISMIRYMATLGQSSDPLAASYHPDGLPLVPGLIELVTPASSAPGERHEHLAGFVGEIAVLGWKGQPENPRLEVGGIGWIRARLWTAYQKDTFVTPPFAGFVSGHSTFSRASAEVMTLITGDAFFPGGLGEFVAPADVYLPPELGPTEPTALQWATYYDAADQAGISRLWSGIHIRADDPEGRKMGSAVGIDAFHKALTYFDGTAVP